MQLMEPDQTTLLKRLDYCDGYLLLGLPEDALHELDRVESSWQDLPQVLIRRMKALNDLCLWDESIKLGKDLIQNHPQLGEIYLMTGFALHRSGRDHEAIDVLHRGPEPLKRSGLYYFGVACCEATLGNHDAAREHVRKALQLDPAILPLVHASEELQFLQN